LSIAKIKTLPGQLGGFVGRYDRLFITTIARRLKMVPGVPTLILVALKALQ
jgi:hypothetical protein